MRITKLIRALTLQEFRRRHASHANLAERANSFIMYRIEPSTLTTR